MDAVEYRERESISHSRDTHTSTHIYRCYVLGEMFSTFVYYRAFFVSSRSLFLVLRDPARRRHHSSSELSSSNALFFLSNVMLPTFVSPMPLSETVLSISMSIFSETFPSLPCLAALSIVCSTPLALSGLTSFTLDNRSLAGGSKIVANTACRSSSWSRFSCSRSRCSCREVGASVRSMLCARASCSADVWW